MPPPPLMSLNAWMPMQASQLFWVELASRNSVSTYDKWGLLIGPLMKRVSPDWSGRGRDMMPCLSRTVVISDLVLYSLWAGQNQGRQGDGREAVERIENENWQIWRIFQEDRRTGRGSDLAFGKKIQGIYLERKEIRRILLYEYPILKAFFIVFILLVSDVPLMSKIQKTS